MRVGHLRGRCSAAMVTDVVQGSKSEKVLRQGLDRFPLREAGAKGRTLCGRLSTPWCSRGF